MCAGFLPHNFHHAKIFMGDSGSMLIGLLLAAGTISLTGRIEPGAVTSIGLVPALLPLVLPVLVLVVPLADMLLAVVRRTRAGRSPFAPDKQHLHHRLLEIGHSHRRAVVLMYLWSALIAAGTFSLAIISGIGPPIVIGIVLVLALVATLRPRLHGRRRANAPHAPTPR
jgi:UDP-GlcNAc:undecaprenyl-phosphate GlcNAc-1-phosphate transferase